MRLPGFTAELTLKNGDTAYHSTRGNQDGGVLAQARIIGNPVSHCFSWCLLNGGSPLGCFFFCDPGRLSTTGTVTTTF